MYKQHKESHNGMQGEYNAEMAFSDKWQKDSKQKMKEKCPKQKEADSHQLALWSAWCELIRERYLHDMMGVAKYITVYVQVDEYFFLFMFT